MSNRDEMLDRIQRERADAAALCDRLSAIDELPDDEQADESFSIHEHAHVLTQFLHESHNDTLVLRDLTGDLVLVWEAGRGDYRIGPLTEASIARDLLDEVEEDGFDESTLGMLSAVVDLLPAAEGPVLSF